MADYASTFIGKKIKHPTEAPTINEELFSHSLVDSRYTNNKSLLSNVPGAPRACTYFRQVRGADEEPVTFQLNSLDVYQSYYKVNKLIIKVDGGESFDFDNETGESSSTLDAYCLFDLVPMKGDVLYMDSGQGRAGLYQVTDQPVIFTYACDKVYKITLQLMTFVDKKILDTLNKRVVKEYFYSSDSILNGGSALLVVDDYFSQKEIMEGMSLLIQYYVKTFYYGPEGTLNLVNNTSNIYDQYLVKFARAVIPSEYLLGQRTINYYDIRSNIVNGGSSTLTVYDAFLKDDIKLLKIVDKDMYLISVNSLPRSPYYGNLYFSKFNYFIANNPDDFKYRYVKYPDFLYPTVYYPYYAQQEVDYVFSKYFYTGNKKKMKNDWERFFYEILENKVYDKKLILEFNDKYYELPKSLQYYYGPLLIWIMNKTRSNNSEYVV